MLKLILNRLNTQDEEIIAEKNRLGSDQEESPQNRSSTLESCVKSTSNISRIWTMSSLTSKSIWQIMACSLMGHHAKYNISANLVRTAEQLYDKTTRAVQMNGSMGEWFRTTVGVRKECFLLSTPFNFFFSNESCLMLWKNMMERLA